MTSAERKQKILALQAEIKAKQQELWALEKDCSHEMRPLTKKELADEWMSVSATCLICNEDFGWRCKNSPTSICEYDDEGSEYCIHCQQPSERK